MSKLRALNDLVIVKPAKITETKTDGGIIISEEINKANTRVTSGEVLSVGKDVITGENGINVGDTVFYQVSNGIVFENVHSVKQANVLWAEIKN